jgi:Carboxypeptidase regulatory-like domain/TonB dependent receptor
MKHYKLLSCIGVCLLGLLSIPAQMSAQAVYGSIIGTVTDSSGAVVAGAKVTVTNIRKGTSDKTTSNADGNYSVQHLIPDSYSLKIEAPSFATAELPEFRVSADSSVRVDIQMKPQSVATETVVTAEAPLLNTDHADVATIFDQRQISELPILNRNFTQFLLLSPGTQRLVSFAHAATENPQASQQTIVNEQHFSGTAYELDGTDNQDPILGIIVINPTLESVTETKITSQNYDAEFGRAIAGVVTAQTKSGSNSIHGSLFEFRRSDATQARDPFNQTKADPVTGRFIPTTMWNQFGASIGGPIIKDKLFYFGDYQGTRRKTGRSVLTSIPTALVHNTCLASSGNCDLSQYLTASGQGQVYDPSTGGPGGVGRTPFAGNLIPVGRMSPVAQKLLAGLPVPNFGAPGAIANNFVASGSGVYDDDSFNVRIDHQTTEKLHIFGRYSLADFRLSGTPIFGALGGIGFGEGGLAGSANTRNQSISSGFDYALSSHWLTDFRFGYVRYHVITQKPGADPKAAANFGLQGVNTSDPSTAGLPAFFVEGSTGDANKLFSYPTGDNGFGAGLGVARCNCPLTESEQQFQFVDNWTRIQGNHSIKFGADLRYAQNLRIPSDANRTGQFGFRTATTSLAGNGGLGVASFLLGAVGDFGRYVTNPALGASPGERQKRTFFYGQDTWRFNSKLTLNYGLRWEVYFPETVDRKEGGGFASIASGGYRVADFGPFGSNGNIQNSWTNFAPRVGIAYELTPKTVVRLGYGRSFDIGVFGSIFGHTVTQNLPVLVNQSLNNGGKDPVFSLNSAPPTYPFPSVAQIQAANGLIPFDNQTSPKVRPERMRLPTLDAWNLTIQREINKTTSVELSYVGNKGTHVFAGNGPSYNANQATVVGFPTLSFNQRRKFHNAFVGRDPNTNLPVPCCDSDISYLGNNANNNFNALEAKVEKRFSQGLQLLAHYTWSKSLDYADEYFPIDPRVNYGLDDNSRKHVFLISTLYELPWGRGKMFASNIPRWLDWVIGGYQFSNITTWSSGLPFTVSYNECGGDRDAGPCRPNRNGGFSTGVTNTPNGLFFFTPVGPLPSNGSTSGAFSRPNVGQFGNVGRNTFFGPRAFTSDLSLLKNFRFTERMNFQFRVEGFNIFNHPVLGFNSAQGNRCIDCQSGDAGKITSIQNGTAPRQFQFGARLTF